MKKLDLVWLIEKMWSFGLTQIPQLERDALGDKLAGMEREENKGGEAAMSGEEN